MEKICCNMRKPSAYDAQQQSGLRIQVHGQQKEEDMSRTQYGLLIIVAFISGLLGGLLSVKFISGEVAFAQNEESPVKQTQVYAKTIIAEEIFLHEKKKGNSLGSEILIPRALLTTEPDGNPKLIMQDKNGNPRFSISLNEKNGATLELIGMNGEKKVLLSEKGSYDEKQLGATLALLDDSGEIRAQIGVQSDNNPYVSLDDPLGKDKTMGRSIKMSFREKDEASISLRDIEGRQRAELSINSNSTCLSLNDLHGKTRAQLGNTELAFGKDGSLKKASPGELSIERRPLSSLVLYNQNGNLLWSAP